MEKHDHLYEVINSYVLGKYGQHAIDQLHIRLRELPSVKVETYDAQWLNVTADCVAHSLGVTRDGLLRSLGFAYLEQMLAKSPFNRHLLCLGSNFIEFINNLDYLHSFIAQQTKTELHMPSFRCVEGLGGSMELFYIAPKCCYSTDLATGLITGISNLVFQSPITCKMRQEKTISLHTSESEPYIEATYDLNLQAIKNDVDPLIIPTMLAQTNKNSEKKISRSNVEEVNEEIAHILLTEGPEGHPLRKAARQKARMRWKKLGDVIRGAAFFKYLASRFQPVIPSHVEINARDFCSFMPFHIMVDTDSNIIHAGLVIQRQVPALKNFGQPLSKVMKCAYPRSVKLTYEVILSLINTTFILYGEYHRKDRQSYFKGHFLLLNEPRRLLYVSSPHVRSVEECSEAGVKISQIPVYDATREFILFGDKTKFKVTRKTGADVSFQQANHLSASKDKELARVKEQLATANAQLDALKNRYKRLYLGLVPLSVVSNLKAQTRQALLPSDNSMVQPLADEDDIERQMSSTRGSVSRASAVVVNGDGHNSSQSRHGGMDIERGVIYLNTHEPDGVGSQRCISVDRGRLERINRDKPTIDLELYQPNYVKYEGVCMMFCDVVQFTGLSDMEQALRDLTTAHKWLSRLCTVFHLEIVESIGDGFLVISHVKGRTRHEAARNMADCALAFMILNDERFPNLQFRAGIHVGKIHGGVIERSQKTFIVWGEDVEFACKMEAFGLPGKIQISPQFFSYINDGSFNYEERTGVAIRGHAPSNYLILTSSKVWSKTDLQDLFGAPTDL